MATQRPVKNLPIAHLSYSALVQYLRSPWSFRKKYILKDYSDDKLGPAAAVGRAFHKAMEIYYNGATQEVALESGLEHLVLNSAEVDWGKTGSLEKSKQEVEQTVKHYFQHEPAVFPRECIVTTEHTMLVKVPGVKIPIKAISDLIIYNEKAPVRPGYHDGKNKRITIVDFKKVSSLPGADDPIPPEYYIQAAFNAWAYQQTYHKRKKGAGFSGTVGVHSVLFILVKTSESKDGSPPVRMIEIEMMAEETKRQFVAVRRLISSVLFEINRATNNWLPNISDMYTGQSSWDEFVADHDKPSRPPRVARDLKAQIERARIKVDGFGAELEKVAEAA